MTKTNADISSEIQVIKSETIPGANTANRVGGTMQDIVDYSDNNLNTSKSYTDALSASGYIYLGNATTATTPLTYGVNDRKYYLFNASIGSNALTNFGGLSITETEDSIYAIEWSGTEWVNEKLPISTKLEISSINDSVSTLDSTVNGVKTSTNTSLAFSMQSLYKYDGTNVTSSALYNQTPLTTIIDLISLTFTADCATGNQLCNIAFFNSSNSFVGYIGAQGLTTEKTYTLLQLKNAFVSETGFSYTWNDVSYFAICNRNTLVASPTAILYYYARSGGIVETVELKLDAKANLSMGNTGGYYAASGMGLITSSSYHSSDFIYFDSDNLLLSYYGVIPTSVACISLFNSNKVSIGYIAGGGTTLLTSTTLSFLKSDLSNHATFLTGYSISDVVYVRASYWSGITYTPSFGITFSSDYILSKLKDVTSTSLSDYSFNTLSYLFGVENDSIYFARNGFTTNNVYDEDGISYSLGGLKNNYIAAKHFVRKYSQFLFPESFLNQVVPVKVNGYRAYPINLCGNNEGKSDITGENVVDKSFPITLSGSGYTSNSFTTTLHNTRSSVGYTHNMRILSIGDSVLGSRWSTDDGKYTGGWCPPSLLQEMIEKDHIDHAQGRNIASISGTDYRLTAGCKAISIGTINNYNQAYKYKGNSYTLRSFNESRAGWTLHAIMRYPCNGNGATLAYDTAGMMAGEALWDMLGLRYRIVYGNTYTIGAENVFDGTSDTNCLSLLRSTPAGYYHWDYSTALYTNLYELYSTKWSTYTNDNDTNRNLYIDQTLTGLYNNPDNPFYDWTTAKLGDIGFNFETYLLRYRTMDDSGNRLTGVAGAIVTGVDGNTYTIGTLITSTTDYDVCKPTHTVIQMSINDYYLTYTGGSDATTNLATISNDVEVLRNKLATIFSSTYSSYVGMIITRCSGTLFPENWKDVLDDQCSRSMLAISANMFLKKVNEYSKTTYSTLSSASLMQYVPIYEIVPPTSTMFTHKTESLLLGNSFYQSDKEDNLHGGYSFSKSIAYQLLGWIYYTLTL